MFAIFFLVFSVTSGGSSQGTISRKSVPPFSASGTGGVAGAVTRVAGAVASDAAPTVAAVEEDMVTHCFVSSEFCVCLKPLKVPWNESRWNG